jgi:hypothetical protein
MVCVFYVIPYNDIILRKFINFSYYGRFARELNSPGRSVLATNTKFCRNQRVVSFNRQVQDKLVTHIMRSFNVQCADSSRNAKWDSNSLGVWPPRGLLPCLKQASNNVYWMYYTVYGWRLTERYQYVLVAEQFHPRIGNLMKSERKHHKAGYNIKTKEKRRPWSRKVNNFAAWRKGKSKQINISQDATTLHIRHRAEGNINYFPLAFRDGITD